MGSPPTHSPDLLTDWHPGIGGVPSGDPNLVYEHLRRHRVNMALAGDGMAASVGAEGTGVLGPRLPASLWLGEVFGFGPESEPDYSDERYWVQAIYLTNFINDPIQRLSYSTYPPANPNHKWITAHNLGEVITGTHTIRPGELVVIREELDRGTPQHIRYVFTAQVVSGVFPVLVTQDGGEPGDDVTQCNFTYEIFDIQLTTSLATGLTPKKRRASIGPYSAARPASMGLAVQIGTIYRLLIAYDEVELVTACDCEGG